MLLEESPLRGAQRTAESHRWSLKTSRKTGRLQVLCLCLPLFSVLSLSRVLQDSGGNRPALLLPSGDMGSTPILSQNHLSSALPTWA